MRTLKERSISGFKWSALERFSSQGVSFIISIVIARILLPEDYGLVGMIGIFLGIANVFVDGGFGTALIRKQNRSELDLSTVFYYNVVISIVFYLILYISAPWIAKFYATAELIPVTRVVGLNIIFGALGTIHKTRLTIAIDLKTQTKISLISILITGALGIYLAYNEFGVWALIFQSLGSTVISTGLMWYYEHWKPALVFSLSSFKELFGFGSKLMLSGLLDTVYTNIYQMVIGKKYNAADLGFFTRASGIAQLPSSEATGVIQRVTFPILSEIQEDISRLSLNYRRLLKMSAFIIFPVMTILAALGEPLIKILLTDKWLPAVPLLQVLCFGYMLHPIHAINLNLLQVKGRSDLFLRLEIVKKLMITVVLFISFSFGVFAICMGTVLVSIIALVINTYYTGKLINLGFWKQAKDIYPYLIISGLAGAMAFATTLILDNSYSQLLVGGVLALCFYLGAAFFMKLEEIRELVYLVLNRRLP